jgi:hypothetical protein
MVNAGPLPTEPAIVVEDRDVSVATFENALLWCFRGEVTAARIAHAQAPHRQLQRRYPRGFAVVTLIAEDVSLLMPEDARALSNSITKAYQPSYCALCEVIEGDGFRAAIVRSITSGIRLFARVPCPAKSFAELATCAAWLAPLMSAASGQRTDPASLERALQRVRLGR